MWTNDSFLLVKFIERDISTVWCVSIYYISNIPLYTLNIQYMYILYTIDTTEDTVIAKQLQCFGLRAFGYASTVGTGSLCLYLLTCWLGGEDVLLNWVILLAAQVGNVWSLNSDILEVEEERADTTSSSNWAKCCMHEYSSRPWGAS